MMKYKVAIMVPNIAKKIKTAPLRYGTYLLIIMWMLSSLINVHVSPILIYDLRNTVSNMSNYNYSHTTLTSPTISIEAKIISPIKIRFDIMKLIEYQSINTSIFNRYIQKNTSNDCIPSSYHLLDHDCCMHQFSIFYLYSLGFTYIKEIHFDKNNINNPIDHKTMWNNNNNYIGCLGLQIQFNKEHRNRPYKYPKLVTDITLLDGKTESYTVIMKYCIDHNITSFCHKWLPKTYNFQIQTEKIDFFKQLPCNNKPNNQYLLKSDLHQGYGIHFIQNSNYLRNYYLTETEQLLSNPYCVINKDYEINMTINKHFSDGLVSNIIAQQFFTNVLRINKCTFHIRAYIMIANYEPLIVLYCGMVIYRSTDPTEIRSNRHQQTGYKSDNDNIDWNLSLKQLEKYYNGRVNGRDIINQITNMTKVIFLSVYDSKASKRNLDFQLYTNPAMDFVLTDDLQVKFLDFNSVAGTHHIPDCFEVKQGTNGSVAVMKNIWKCIETKKICEEMVNIEIELAIKKKNGDKIDKLDSIKNFEIIVWE